MSSADVDGRYRQRSESDSEGGDSSSARDSDDDEDDIVATQDMCHFCFDTLLKELLPETTARGRSRSPKRRQTSKKSTSQRNNDADDSFHGDFDDIRERLERQSGRYSPPAVECPLFVTWSKLRSTNHPPLILSEASSSGIVTPPSGFATPDTTTASSSNITDTDEASQQQRQLDESNYELRGCIGTLAAKSLKHALSEFAITSALHDQRFDPIELHELPFLRVGVSLLVKYEECKHCLDWEVGVHGIIIKFESPGKKGGGGGGGKGCGGRDSSHRTYSATYLPEVAYEQLWSQEEAVLSLVRKAGYRGAITDELLSAIRCTRYQSSKCRLSYREYALARHEGVDPLQNVTVDEAMRRVKASKPCVNL